VRPNVNKFTMICALAQIFASLSRTCRCSTLKSATLAYTSSRSSAGLSRTRCVRLELVPNPIDRSQ
jgi:hypothetical protein